MSAPFLSETRERFMKAVLTKLPVEAIRDAYLFQPIKQGGVESGVAVVAAELVGDREAPDKRYTVYTANYRHTLKGPDRGKWEWNLVEEADAPLLSIESVVRGVQRRSGDVDAPDHMTADDLRAALRLPPAEPAPDARAGAEPDAVAEVEPDAVAKTEPDAEAGAEPDAEVAAEVAAETDAA